MKTKTQIKTILFSITLLAMLLLPFASATNYITLQDHFDFRNGANLVFSSPATYQNCVISGNYVNFTNLVINNKTSNISISSPTNLILNEPDTSGAISYTTSTGIQTLKVPNTPSQVTINGSETTTAWTYSNGLLQVITTGYDTVKINFSPTLTPTPTPGSIGGPSASPTISPSPISSPSDSTSPTPISETLKFQPMTYIVIVLIIIMIAIAMVGTEKNKDKKIKSKMQTKDWNSPL